MFIAIFTSKPNAWELREATKPAHDEYWNTRMDKLRFAGPMLADDGKTRLGQILVVDLPDRAAAEQLVVNDPFVKAGVFTDYRISRFRVSVESGKSV